MGGGRLYRDLDPQAFIYRVKELSLIWKGLVLNYTFKKESTQTKVNFQPIINVLIDYIK